MELQETQEGSETLISMYILCTLGCTRTDFPQLLPVDHG